MAAAEVRSRPAPAVHPSPKGLARHATGRHGIPGTLLAEAGHLDASRLVRHLDASRLARGPAPANRLGLHPADASRLVRPADDPVPVRLVHPVLVRLVPHVRVHRVQGRPGQVRPGRGNLARLVQVRRI
jgi:hypothetical protein